MRTTSETLLHEVIDRVVRFHQHLTKVRHEFFSDEEKQSDKVLFVSSYGNCLQKIFEVAVRVFLSGEPENKINDSLSSCLKKLKLLHQKLSLLPRPSESNELKRFNRIINVQISIFKNKGKKDYLNDVGISIYVQEAIGEQIFRDPLQEFKVEEINKLITDCGINASKFPDQVQEDSIHITIPRIDAANPSRWPTLIHELGHQVMSTEFTHGKEIQEHFLEFISASATNTALVKSYDRINLRSWLTECWCDLFAAVLMGPCFWYSQCSAFIFSGIMTENGDYPSPIFRLNLIRRLLEKRLDNTLTAETREAILEYTKLVDSLDNTFDDQGKLQLFHLFQTYFTRTFFTIQDGNLVLGSEQFNNLIKPLLKYTLDIRESIIKELVQDLNKRLPIPSKRRDPDSIIETYNSVQEIIQSAWIYKVRYLNKEISDKVKGLDVEQLDSQIPETFSFILREYNNFDQSILKSIQVSEWFSLFAEKFDYVKRVEHIKTINISRTEITAGTQLVDFEIYKAIKDKSLRIVPLMDPKQIGSTSVDIRLGTSFQYYYPNQFGILDFTDEDSMASTQRSTKTIDLDYLKSTTLAPGNFLLGHSMEYIVLNDKLSAQLDGRSSFARSGLEIHMTAGFVEPGYTGVLTFEFYNAGPNPIRLYPGMRIGQLRFIPVNEPAEGYSKKSEAKYRGHLSQHHGLQSNDDEVGIIKRELLEHKIRLIAKQFSKNHGISLTNLETNNNDGNNQ